MPNFTLPPSFRSYCKDRAVRSAVDHILDCGKKLKVPADLEWDRLPDFHAAVLAAHQVRCDYATALHGLWNEVWQPALDDCGFADSLEPLSLNEAQEYSDYPGDAYSLWAEELLERVYDKDGRKLGLGVDGRPQAGAVDDLAARPRRKREWTWPRGWRRAVTGIPNRTKNNTSTAAKNSRGSRTTAAASRSTRSTARRSGHCKRLGATLAGRWSSAIRSRSAHPRRRSGVSRGPETARTRRAKMESGWSWVGVHFAGSRNRRSEREAVATKFLQGHRAAERNGSISLQHVLLGDIRRYGADHEGGLTGAFDHQPPSP